MFKQYKNPDKAYSCLNQLVTISKLHTGWAAVQKLWKNAQVVVLK